MIMSDRPITRSKVTYCGSTRLFTDIEYILYDDDYLVDR